MRYCIIHLKFCNITKKWSSTKNFLGNISFLVTRSGNQLLMVIVQENPQFDMTLRTSKN